MPAPFHSLTPRGQAGRLRALAADALSRYRLEPLRIRLLAHDNNCLFRVDYSEYLKVVLRISRPRPGLLGQLQAETAFLDQFASEVRGVRVRPNQAGELVTLASAPGVPEPRYCVLFGWLPGKNLADLPDGENYLEWGYCSASLHKIAESFDHTPFDLPHHTDAYDSKPQVLQHHPELAPPDLVARVADATHAILAAAPGPLRVIHGDLHQWNIRMHHGWAHPFDFEYIALGTPLQDLGITAHYMARLDDPANALTWFRKGYEECRPWPAPDPTTLPTLAAGRALALLNECLQHPDPHIRVYAPAIAVRLRDLAAQI